MSDNTASIKISEEFYTHDKLIVLLVEDTLYRVHSYLLSRESAVFRDMLDMPPVPGQQEGVSNEHPIVLPEVKKSHFESLLRLLYKSKHDSKQTETAEQWTEILGLADKWDMQAVGSFAAQHLSTLLTTDPVYRFSLARRFNLVEDWWMPAFSEICHMDRTLNQQEWERLTWKEIEVIAGTREQIGKERSQKYGDQSKGAFRCGKCKYYFSGDNCPRCYPEQFPQIVQEAAELLGRR